MIIQKLFYLLISFEVFKLRCASYTFDTSQFAHHIFQALSCPWTMRPSSPHPSWGLMSHLPWAQAVKPQAGRCTGPGSHPFSSEAPAGARPGSLKGFTSQFLGVKSLCPLDCPRTEGLCCAPAVCAWWAQGSQGKSLPQSKLEQSQGCWPAWAAM